MKKTNFKISKNVAISIIGGAIALIVILSTQSISTIDAQVTKPIGISGNENSGASISRLQLAPKNDKPSYPDAHLNNGDFDGKYNNDGLNFRVYGTSILDNIISIGDAFFDDHVSVGYTSISAGTSSTELMVNGHIMVKELADPLCNGTAVINQTVCNAIPQVALCTNVFGVLVRGGC